MVSAGSKSQAVWRRAIVAGLGLVALGWSDDLARERSATRNVELVHPAGRDPRRALVRGNEFPDGVIALTWDDGPDQETLALAKYLHTMKVSATFFVVGEWINGVSDEPGVGTSVYRTGYAHLPILGELVALGHRIGTHTRNHAVLAGTTTATVIEQLGQGQRAIDPFVTNELRMFRAPGGAWTHASDVAMADPFLASIIGPVHWDIDAKDWDSSLYCRTSRANECEASPVPDTTRVRPSVIAQRYLEQTIATRRGVVLMHDRVGDVGSHYALDVAHALIPALRDNGFVMAGPVLAFNSLTDRLLTLLPHTPLDPARAIFADVDGDGRADLCEPSAGSIVCSRAVTKKASPAQSALATTTFDAPRVFTRLPEGTRATDIADVDGDGRADVCVLTDDAIDCARSTGRSETGAFTHFRSELGLMRGSASSFRLADVDGDGRADACVRSADGVVCATSTGRSFNPPRLWLRTQLPDDGSRLDLADLDGDKRADLCVRSGGGGLDCSISDGSSFSARSRWSRDGDFAGTTGPLLLADLNGDGRADVCATTAAGVSCALSGGHGFKHASSWSSTRAGDLRLADINGDGRADLCTVGAEITRCGLAP